VDKNGTRYYSVTNAANFRSAIGLGSAATHAHDDYYSTSASRTANTFLAAPNGSAGAAQFRKIVAADIPTLNQNTTGSAAKLTTARSLYVALGTVYNSSSPVTFDGSANKALPISGTLAVAHGGTGMTQDYTSTIATGVVFRAWGHTAYLRVEVTKNFTDGYSSFVLGTVPSGYRPPNEVCAAAIVFDTGRHCLLAIKANGEIRVAGAGGAALGNHLVVGTATWVI
jgi:hypothetical protein